MYTALISNCQQRRWDRLETDIEGLRIDMDARIVARATFDTYHPLKNEELSIFTSKLETQFNRNSPHYGQVHLGDFVSAYCFAKDMVKDTRIAATIRDYVNSNADAFGRMLSSANVESAFKTDCINCFPFMAHYRIDAKPIPKPVDLSTSSDDLSSSELELEPDFTQAPPFKMNFPEAEVARAELELEPDFTQFAVFEDNFDENEVADDTSGDSSELQRDNSGESTIGMEDNCPCGCGNESGDD
jgi:hypothetical protein